MRCEGEKGRGSQRKEERKKGKRKEIYWRGENIERKEGRANREERDWEKEGQGERGTGRKRDREKERQGEREKRERRVRI